ncbi:MAG: UDP-N-acetylmuramoyl-tripeptide--D-alanyl-D-alanine ligase [Candidatus Levybacteria bacterium]|nr:UDP-N-acetylmuramoyl-tripeptide--D-alanyl-D-alanine ligase [Candidatus Levybacteria bacterium]
MTLRKAGIFFILSYLRLLAKIQLMKISPIIVGVGGASGKSSLCAALASVLSSKYRVKQSRGKNSSTGIPLDILSIDPGSYEILDWIRIITLSFLGIFTNWKQYDVYIAEMGIDGPKEPSNMSYLLKIVTPQIAALTNITFEHSVYFESVASTEKDILKETMEQEMLLLKSLPGDGFAAVNIDDPIIEEESLQLQARKSTVSIEKGTSDFYASELKVTLAKFSFSANHLGETYKFEIDQMLPVHYARSFLMALSIALYLGIPIEDAILNLKRNFKLPPGRLSVFDGIKNTTIIDSSYNNATLPPILDILSLLKKVSGKRRKVAILADMRELGLVSQKIHKIVARKIIETCDFAVLIGPQMVKYVAPVLKKSKFDFICFETFTQAKEEILGNIKEKDVILVKGSQNTLFLERVVEILLANSRDKEKLCRRGEFWDKKRSETP